MSIGFEHVHSLSEVREKRPTVLAVGNFDGVHRGHQELLRRMIAAAASIGARPAVLTFFPHPLRVIRGLTGRHYLMRLEERAAILREMGVELVVTHPFNEEVRRTPAGTFVANLVHHLNLSQIWGGEFSLGYKREGDVDFLRAQGKEYGFTVHQIDGKQMWDDEMVSSSRIRRGLAAGDIADVNGCLGRPYCVSGTVIHGASRGRTIGFPTANLDTWDQQVLPTNGVYATRAVLNGQAYPAATNVGVRPTVNGAKVTVEAHLLDFDTDLYDEMLSLHFLARVRPEKKFDGIDQLREQIGRDVATVRDLLK